MRALSVPFAAWLVMCTTPALALDAATPLDGLPRVLAAGEELPCTHDAVPLVRYAGTHLRYQKPLRIHPSFTTHLADFERIVARVALAHYGRAPRRIVHIGAFNCRKMRRYPDWVSEHALGNAIDIAGFDFGPLPRAQAGDLAPALRRAQRVRVEEHWKARGEATAVHAAFLHDLARTLAQHPEVFNVVLGPGYPGHHNHLHLDAAPYRVVEFVE